MLRRKCEICGLRSRREDGSKRFFMARFPLEKDRCKEWVRATGNEDLAYIPVEKLHELKFVCGKHFQNKDFNTKKTRLKRTAVPSIRLTAEPLSDEVLKEFPCILFKEEYERNELPSVSLAAGTGLMNFDHTCNLLLKEGPSTSSDYTTSMETIYYECDIPPVTCTVEVHTTEQHILDKAGLSTHRSSTALDVPDKLEANVDKNTVDQKDPKPLKDVRKQRLPKNRTDNRSQELTPRKKKLVRKLSKCKLKLKIFQQKIKIFDSIKSKALKTMLLSASRNQNRCAQGKRWTENDKALAIAMYKKSPKLYRYLRQLIPLPSIRTLQAILSKMPIQPGVSPIVINHLSRKAKELSLKEKTCVLLFDEISLKKRLIYNSASDKIEGFQDLGEHGRTGDLADKALVLMLQGVHKKIKQPFAHYFVKGTISSEKLVAIIKNAIKIISEAGFKIIATVCDQGPTNVGALNLLKKFSSQQPDSNYFLVDNNKVFIIYDVPHLFKSLRNNFYEAGELIFDGKKAKWSHLIELNEKNTQTLHFKKITPLHVEPKFRSKMKVKLAAQVLSNDVAAILKLLAETYNDSKRDEVLQTANVIDQLDKLFDATNGPSSRKDVKKGIRENVSKNSMHHKLWPELKNKIKTMHFLKSDSQLRLRNVRCVNGYYITISSLQDIWNYVQSIGFKYLNLRQLNQDSLENLFGLIRQHSPTNQNPTCHHFTASLKSTILTKLSTPIRGANCEVDDNQLILDFHDLVFQNAEVDDAIEDHSYISEMNVYEYDNPSSYVDSNIRPILHLPDTEIDMEERLFETFDKQPVVYVSGYLASVLIKTTHCHKCCDSIRTLTPGNDKIYNFIALKEWWKDKLSLTYPTLELCQTVDVCVSVFEQDVKPCLHHNDIGKYCRLMMHKEVNLNWLCEEHGKDLMDMLLSRLAALLIRNECKKMNFSINEVEQKNSNKNKISQIMSTAK